MATAIYNAYPDRHDRRLSIGDSSPVVGDCENHPENSHKGGLSFDMNYYTLGKTNHTQYVPKGEIRTRLTTYCGDLNTLVYDWERNYVLWVGLKKIFPSMVVMVGDEVFAYTQEQVRKTYGSTEAAGMSRWIKATGKTDYMHHIHAHVVLGSDVHKAVTSDQITKKVGIKWSPRKQGFQ